MSTRTERRPDQTLVIDNVLSTQPELGPSIPDGGYGWIVFLSTLFFQLLIPSLLVSFGIFLAFSRMKTDTVNDINPKLWDHNLLYVPLFFIASWTGFDPACRQFIAHSTWPKLFAIGGTCLTSAGLLFLWMGMTGENNSGLYILAGIITGIGSSIQMAQCDILLAQYFRLKLPAVIHISHAVSALGFILAPIVLGHHLLVESQTHILLWYQAIILQGLILNLFLRKPMYLKSKSPTNYNYVTANADEEEDIFSKNSRELQIKVQNGESSQIQTHELPVQTQNEEHIIDVQPNTSQDNATNTKIEKEDAKNWVTFEDDDDDDDDDDEETTKYVKVENEEENDDPLRQSKKTDPRQWEKFEDDPDKPAENNRNNKNLQLEMAFGREGEINERPSTRSITGMPIPLFSDTPVNNNNTYSYDALEDPTDSIQSSVFMPTTTSRMVEDSPFNIRGFIELLQTPTFYKSFITVMTTRWSLFVFFSLYPSFLFQEVKEIKLRHLTNLVGTISLAVLIFAGVAYWINVEKRWRAKAIWFLSWIGALGYFMMSDYFTEGLLLFGAVQVVLSIAALQHVATPLLGLTVKGEATKEYTLICILTFVAFFIFIPINASFKQVFRLMALLNFLTGCLWLANYIYKRLR